MVKVLVAFLLTGLLWPGPGPQAQSLISESGRIIFFNSLDSARGAALNRLASLAACWLYYYDPRDSFSVLLDLRPAGDSADQPAPALGFGTNASPDSGTHITPDPVAYASLKTIIPNPVIPNPVIPELGYDNLFGNSLSYTDSSAEPTDPSLQRYYNRLGLRIRIPLADSAAESTSDLVSDSRTLLRLLEYGVAHYEYLKQMQTLCLSDNQPGPVTLVPQDITRILARPLSLKVRTALKNCSPIP
jgi:hypothetical protein